MGYQAPSAEEVYRYAFRLDGHDRNLTDRFSWSIVFVNDSSSVCKEFLQRYCVELCFRTADRIRFIFFSDLPMHEVQQIAQEMNQEGPLAAKGMLRNIIKFLRSPFRRYDFEEEPWRGLRPAALYPLRSVVIEQALSHEVDFHTAMPGSGIALEFAQRLGIGRYVPCMLAFTDVGALSVDIMPIGEMSPPAVYEHVREWIDRFYEANHASLERWNRIEKQVQALVHQAESSLTALRQWRNERAAVWRSLLQLSQFIQLLSSGARLEGTRWESLWRDEFDLPPAIRMHIVDFAEALKDLERRSALVRQMEAAILRIESATDADQFTALLEELAATVFPGIDERVPKSVHDALRQMQSRRLPSGIKELREELFGWWRHRAALPLPAKRFKKLRDDWIYLAGKDRRIIKDEHAVVLGAVDATALAAEPAQAAAAVLERLAAHYGLRGDTQEWRKATERYRACVEYHLRELCESAPGWLMSRRPDLAVGSCVPRLEGTSEGKYLEFLGSHPDIQRVLEQTSSEREAQSDALLEELRGTFRRQQILVADTLRHLRAHFAPKERERPDLTEEFLSLLQPLRRQLELQAMESPKASQRLTPLRVDRTLADGLHRALDEYDHVVESIVFPHKDGPSVKSVRLPATVLEAVAVAPRPGQVARTKELRSTLGELAANEASQKDFIREIQDEVVTLSPAGRLWQGLVRALAPERLEQATGAFPGPSVGDKIETLVREHRIVECLTSLQPTELVALMKAVGSEKPLVLPANSVTHNSLIDDILCSVGLFCAPTGEVVTTDLKKKIERDEFDVFMAHSSKDKAAVLSVCRRLRALGLYPWIDVEQIPPGQWFQDVIQSVIPTVKAAAIFFGDQGLGRWQALELRTFVSQCVERKVPLIPVLLPGVARLPPELLFMRELHYVRFNKSTDEEEVIDQLVWGITGEKSRSNSPSHSDAVPGA